MFARITDYREDIRTLDKLYDNVVSTDDTDIVLPGDRIRLPANSLTGHGIREVSNQFYATICGRIQTIGNLTYVQGTSGYYIPMVGDVLIGIVTSIEADHWLVEIGSFSKAKLTPQSLILPTGEQRCKTQAELMDLRSFFNEHNIIYTEVQKTYPNGPCHLHMRNSMYGQLTKGILFKMKPSLIKRMASHEYIIDQVVKLIIGVNGYIWLTSVESELTAQNTFAIARVNNLLNFLNYCEITMYPDLLKALFIESIEQNIQTYDLTDIKVCLKLLYSVLKK